MSDRIGDLLLLEKLAAGGMAEVYRAVQQGYGGFEKVVAVKRILPHFASDEEFKNMFVMEANLSGLFMHPNVVSIFSNGEADGYLFLVMEFVDGRNVRQMLARCDKAKRRIPIEYSCFIVAEAAKGLEYAHTFQDQKTGESMEIVHRDMSPQNIMLSYDGAVKIVDFGIAKAAARSEHTRAGVLKGKFGYMSPEQAQGMPIDARTDVFALGIIFFELLTQRRLFSHDDDMRTLQLVRECRVPRPSKYNPSISPALDRIVLKALAKNRNERYASAGDFYGDLQRFINQKYPNFIPTEFAKFLKAEVFTEDIANDKKKREMLAADAPARLGNPQLEKKNIQGDHLKKPVEDKDATHDGFELDDGEATAISQLRQVDKQEIDPPRAEEKVPQMEKEPPPQQGDFSDQKPEITMSQIVEPEGQGLSGDNAGSGSDMGEGTMPEADVELSVAGVEVETPSVVVDTNKKDKNSAFPSEGGPSHLSLSMTMGEPVTSPKRRTISPKRSAITKRKAELETVEHGGPKVSSGPSKSRPEVTPLDNDSTFARLMRNPLFVLCLVAAGVGYYFQEVKKEQPEVVQKDKRPDTGSKNQTDVAVTPDPVDPKPAETRNEVKREPASFREPVYEAQGATGYLSLQSFPNATKILVNGKVLVDDETGNAVRTPTQLVPVEVGTHNIYIENSALGMSWRGQVEISFDSVKKLEVRMQ